MKKKRTKQRDVKKTGVDIVVVGAIEAKEERRRGNQKQRKKGKGSCAQKNNKNQVVFRDGVGKKKVMLKGGKIMHFFLF